jgi:pyruvate kinase
MRDEILERAFEKRGAVTAVARGCGISTAAVSRWRRVPKSRLDEVSRILNIPVSELSPDIGDMPDSVAA